jgi:hypothetical protein
MAQSSHILRLLRTSIILLCTGVAAAAAYAETAQLPSNTVLSAPSSGESTLLRKAYILAQTPSVGFCAGLRDRCMGARCKPSKFPTVDQRRQCISDCLAEGGCK